MSGQPEEPLRDELDRCLITAATVGLQAVALGVDWGGPVGWIGGGLGVDWGVDLGWIGGGLGWIGVDWCWCRCRCTIEILVCCVLSKTRKLCRAGKNIRLLHVRSEVETGGSGGGGGTFGFSS